jgi:hypothetical protein
MAQPLDQAAIQALIDAATQALQAQLTQQQNQIAQQQLDLAAQQQAFQQSQADLNNAQNQITALQQAAQQPVQQPVQQQVPPRAAQVVVDFAYSPATAGDPNDLINYKVPTGHKIQKAAIEKLDVTSNLASEHLYEFLEAFRTRAIANGWIETVLSIMRGQEVLNMIDHYGMITEAEIIAKYNTYMFQGGRMAQDSHNIQNCLEASLTPEARMIIYAEKDKYTIRRVNVAAAPAI